MDAKNKFKKIKRLILSAFFASVIPLSATAYEITIMDNADLLTNEQEAALVADMEPITEYGDVVFYTNSSSYSTGADELAQAMGQKVFGGKSGTLFLIDMFNRRIQIYSEGDIYKIVGSAWADGITDNIYTYATDGDYYTCAKSCFNQIYTLLEGGKISVPMRYVSNALFAIALSLLILFIKLRFSRKRINFGKSVEMIVEKRNEGKTDEQKLLEKVFIGEKAEHVTLLEKTLTNEVVVLHRSSSGGGGGGGSSGGGGGGGGGGGHGF